MLVMNTTAAPTQAPAPIHCLGCGKQIKNLGIASVACWCRSFAIGLSDINGHDETGAMRFGVWPVTMADIKAIHLTRCERCDHFEASASEQGGGR